MPRRKINLEMITELIKKAHSWRLNSKVISIDDQVEYRVEAYDI